MRAGSALIVVLLTATTAAGSHLVPPPLHQPLAPPAHRPLAGIIRIWGNAQSRDLVGDWEKSLRRVHPTLRLERRLTGSDIGMAGMYTGQADIAVMGREATESEVKAFEWVFQYKPMRVEIMTGSVDRAGKSPALVVFVHRNNPIDRLTMPELEAVFAHEPRQAMTPIRVWSQLGIRDTCAGQPIRLYAPLTESGTGTFFRVKALGDTNKMNWEYLTEFEDAVGQQSVDDSGRRILSALAADRCGMAVSNLQDAGPSVKPLALGASAGGPYYPPTKENIIGRKYPLARGVYAYVNRPAGGVDPQVKAFLEYVLSDEGQALIPKSGYLPLTDPLLRVERARLQRLD